MLLVKLLTAIVICQLAGLIGSLFTFSSIPTWYASLQKPSLAPPNWVFAPVWTTLFLLMGVAVFFIWKQGLGNKKVKKALALFLLQLGLNILWSALFFGLRNPWLALGEIILLWLAILLTLIHFYRLSRVAGLLLGPYLLWVTFAAWLNFLLARLNF